LVSMRERCSAVGASFVVNSSPGAGTRIEVAIPLAHHEDKGNEA